MAYTKKAWVKPEATARTPFAPKFPASVEQEAIFDVIRNSDSNVHCEASPGSGKSTTIKWAMTLEKRKKSAMLAFSKAIITEIEPDCPPWLDVKTAHSFGYGSLAKKFGRLFVSKNKVMSIYQEMFPNLNPDNASNTKDKMARMSAMYDTIKIIDLLRATLTDETDIIAVQSLANQFNIDLSIEDVMPLLRPMFVEMLNKNNVIDFTDMMWMPIRLDLEIPQYDMMYVDERQDLNNLMMTYVQRMTKERIMTVGDQNQSIFGFSGADTQATERLVNMFPGQCSPLNVCYRCATDIVELAKTIYDKIEPFSKNPRGEVSNRDEIDYDMPDNSMILSRRNANLIKPCFEMLKLGRKAIIKGKDIGEGLVKLINQLKATSVFDLDDKLDSHLSNRIEKLLKESKPRASAIEQVTDQVECIKIITKECGSVNEVLDRINLIFDEKKTGIVCSSIHRSKGLEAEHVSIVDYNRIRLNTDKMTDDDHIQEKNLHFVAVTRAIKSLHLISTQK